MSDEQLEPFGIASQHLVVNASAGSGKTRTLTYLVSADLASGTPPESIVVFSFTEKAADELRARIHAISTGHVPGVDISRLFVGTIHSWCLDYLLGRPAFYNISGVDELHLDALVSRLYDRLGIEIAYGAGFPSGIRPFLADLEVLYNEHLPVSKAPAKIRGSIGAFLQLLETNRLLTFGGMIRSATDELRANGPVNGLSAVYIDEYQDVNPAQVALIAAMISESGRIIATGDDLQCIYQWRGSDVKRLLNFQKEFHPASVYRLPTNYRSRPGIIQVANTVAGRIAIRDPQKQMKGARTSPACPTVHWLSFEDDERQARGVAEIVTKFASLGVPWRSMAVLLRSVRSAGRPIVDALVEAGVPVDCPVLGRGGRFITEIAIPVFDWMSQEHTDPRNEVEEAAAESRADILWSSARKWIKDANESLFWQAFDEWQNQVSENRSTAYNVRGCFYGLLDRFGLRAGPDDSDLLVGLGITSQIIRNVEEIHRRRITGQPRRTPRGVIGEIYHALVRRHADFGESLPVEGTGEGVVVTTVHQAKGLEWPIVIVPTLSKNRFPLKPSNHRTSFPPEVAGRYGTSMEDERRLFYVAATRAKERLFLLDPTNGAKNKKSVFLSELENTVQRATDVHSIDGQVWRIDKKDLSSSDAGPLVVGLSDLLLYIECPFQFGLRRVTGIQPAVGDELGYGESLHELIHRRLESRKPWSESELDTESQKHVFLPYMSESGEASSRRAIKNRVRRLQALGLLDREIAPEVEVTVNLGAGAVTGIIDVLEVEADGVVRIRDWKSNVHEEFLTRYYRQMQFYVFALRRRGMQVNGADIVDVARSADSNSLVARNVDISEEAIGATIRELTDGLRGIAAHRFQARPSMSVCSICDIRQICSVRVTDE